MRGYAVCRLSRRQIDCDSNDLRGADGEVQGIRDGKRTVGNADAIPARERNFLDGLGVDLVDAGCLVERKGDGDGCDGEVGAAEDVGDLEANLLGLCS